MRTLSILAAAALTFVVSEGSLHAHGKSAHRLRGAVVTSDGTMVDRFVVVARPKVDKPVLMRRFHFTNGTFDLDLDSKAYEILVTARQYVAVRLDLTVSKNTDS